MADAHIQCVVIGAGVVGLAVASRLARQGVQVMVLERHDLIGSETSSRNSEVIHAGIYYPQGSLKAQLCVNGKQQLYAYCDKFNIPYRRCGKIIVATHDEQIATVQAYIGKAADNGVHDLRWLSAAQVNTLEPQVRTVGGVLSPSTGIIDSHAFMLSLQGELERHGGQIAFNTAVEKITTGTGGSELHTDGFTLGCDWLINSAGLSAPAADGKSTLCGTGVLCQGALLCLLRFPAFFASYLSCGRRRRVRCPRYPGSCRAG